MVYTFSQIIDGSYFLSDYRWFILSLRLSMIHTFSQIIDGSYFFSDYRWFILFLRLSIVYIVYQNVFKLCIFLTFFFINRLLTRKLPLHIFIKSSLNKVWILIILKYCLFIALCLETVFFDIISKIQEGDASFIMKLIYHWLIITRCWRNSLIYSNCQHVRKNVEEKTNLLDVIQ